MSCDCVSELSIVMPRGDVRPFKFGVYEPDGETISDIEFDDIFFTVKKNASDLKFVFQKRLSDGTISAKDEDGLYGVVIEAADTDPLPFGEYVFDIEVFKNNLKSPAIKQTTRGVLILENEVTYARNEG